MCLKLDSTFFVEMVWLLVLIGIVVSSWYTIVTGFPYNGGPNTIFGFNINLVYLFMFALMLWGLYNMKYPREHRKGGKKKPRRR